MYFKLKKFLKFNQKSNGQIGDGTSGNNRLIPVEVSTSGVLNGKNVIYISAGGSRTCVILNDLKVYCWGYNG
jgi:alpha-tubulin suppressor-like RCC1 family protein